MEKEKFLEYAAMFSGWMAEYYNNIEQHPVAPCILPGDIKKQLPLSPPDQSESIERIFSDFQTILLPGITHWQHPQFFAYFPASNSEPSILAEMLTATIGAQCMVWYTSPAAEELEERMIEWMRDMIGLPVYFTGVIQDTASTSTLVSPLTAREKYSNWEINQSGFGTGNKFRVYASTQAHSSVDKAVRISGIGINNLVKIQTDDNFALDPIDLERAIIADIETGYQPLCIVATFGTTGSTATDPLREIGLIAEKYQCWLHVDAAYAGTALVLEEIRPLADGLELADTIVFNPHKWMFTNFDCSVYLVKDKNALTRTFDIMPDYLKTPQDLSVNNYRDWGIQLGRRFRSLKLWFVIRYYGIEGLQHLIRGHLMNARWLENEINLDPAFELLAPVNFGLVCFRFHPTDMHDEDLLNQLNEKLVKKLNESGKILVSHTKLNGKYTIRMVAGQVKSCLGNWQTAWQTVKLFSREINF
jgi:aromatic-L-amino-acid decarboxylase